MAGLAGPVDQHIAPWHCCKGCELSKIVAIVARYELMLARVQHVEMGASPSFLDGYGWPVG